MKQDMIAVMDLGSTRNTDVARAVRALGVYSEIVNYDVTAEELLALPNVKGVIANGGPNGFADGKKITLGEEVKKSGLPVYTFDYAEDGEANAMPERDEDIAAALKSFVFGTCKAQPNWN
ncbi:MAG: glutamine amidotransferase-related protein, partial [Eubacteriales bacterium]